MNIGAALSTAPDPRQAVLSAAREAAEALHGRAPSLAVLFVSPHHAEAADAVLEALHEAANPSHVIGCAGEAIVGGRREVEGGPAVSVWLAELPGQIETFELRFLRTAEGGVLAGWHFDPDDLATYLVLADPFTFPADLLLRYLNEEAPGTLVMGGMASGGMGPGQGRLFLDDRVLDEGAVGARITGVPVRLLVSQGCRPVGQPFTVTRAETNVIYELGGMSPLQRLGELIPALSPSDRRLLTEGLQVGRVIDEYADKPGLGDFLVRGVTGADQQSGAIVVGDHVEVGETVQFHVRDAASADADFRARLALARDELADSPAAGGLLFTCNGRGTRMFQGPDHDATAIAEVLGDIPLAGFFAAGELGPVGGRNFVHGFTASLALFEDRTS